MLTLHSWHTGKLDALRNNVDAIEIGENNTGKNKNKYPSTIESSSSGQISMFSMATLGWLHDSIVSSSRRTGAFELRQRTTHERSLGEHFRMFRHFLTLEEEEVRRKKKIEDSNFDKFSLFRIPPLLFWKEDARQLKDIKRRYRWYRLRNFGRKQWKLFRRLNWGRNEERTTKTTKKMKTILKGPF